MRLGRTPVLARGGDVRPLLLDGMNDFFLALGRTLAKNDYPTNAQHGREGAAAGDARSR